MKKVIILLVLLGAVLTACGTPSSSTSLPTNTPLPLPTETPIPSPTNTPIPPIPTLEPTPTPDPLIFQDDFDSVLDSRWEWTREDDRYWSLTNNPGWLEIVARPGHVGSGDVKNLLLRTAPEGNFELETRLNFKPTGNFQIAGLVIYESAANHIQFGRAFCNATPCAGDGYYIDLFEDGNLDPENFATSASEIDMVEIRLRREGNIFTAYVREEGGEWQVIGAHMGNIQPLFVGLVAGQAVGTVPQPAQFDYFIVNALP